MKRINIFPWGIRGWNLLRQAMNILTNRFRSFVMEDHGPVAVEYAVLLALIIVVAVSSISQLGLHVAGVFDDAAVIFQAL